MLVFEIYAIPGLEFLEKIVREDHRLIVLATGVVEGGVESQKSFDVPATRRLHEQLTQRAYQDIPQTFEGKRVVTAVQSLTVLYRRDPHTGGRLQDDSPLTRLDDPKFQLYAFAITSGKVAKNADPATIEGHVDNLEDNTRFWQRLAADMQQASIESANPHPMRHAYLQTMASIWWTAAANPSVSAATTSNTDPDWHTLLQSSQTAFVTAARNRLCETKKLSDLYTIATDMGIDYENIPGKEKNSYARELLGYLMRRSQLAKIIPYL